MSERGGNLEAVPSAVEFYDGVSLDDQEYFSHALEAAPASAEDFMRNLQWVLNFVELSFGVYLNRIMTASRALREDVSAERVDVFEQIRREEPVLAAAKIDLLNDAFHPFLTYIECHQKEVQKMFGARFYEGMKNCIKECFHLLDGEEDIVMFFRKFVLQWRLLKTEVVDPGWLDADMEAMINHGLTADGILKKGGILLRHFTGEHNRGGVIQRALTAEKINAVRAAILALNKGVRHDASYTRKNFDLIEDACETVGRAELALFCKHESDADQPEDEKMATSLLQHYREMLQAYKRKEVSSEERVALSAQLREIAAIFKSAETVMVSVLVNHKKTGGQKLNEFDVRRVEHVLESVVPSAFPALKRIGGLRRYFSSAENNPVAELVTAYQEVAACFRAFVAGTNGADLPQKLQNFSRILSMFSSEYVMLVARGYFAKPKGEESENNEQI